MVDGGWNEARRVVGYDWILVFYLVCLNHTNEQWNVQHQQQPPFLRQILSQYTANFLRIC